MSFTHIKYIYLFSQLFYRYKISGVRIMPELRLAIAGVGNCASSLVQGLFYYRGVSNGSPVPGLMHNVLSDYRISDIRPVAAFDIDSRKVGRDLSEAIFAKPNCTKTFHKDVPMLGVKVEKAPELDGVAEHMRIHQEERTFVPAPENDCEVAEVLKEAGAEVLVNYMPVGSEEAARHYAKACLEAGCALVNCMPVFIASDPSWAKRFEKAGIPIIGDDIKSQVGATIVHRVLTKLFADRGVKIDKTYQLNTGGNTDFLNMLDRNRLVSKKISKTESVQSQLGSRLDPENIHIGPSDYVPWQKDNKVCFIRIEGRKFGDVPLDIELRLSVEDSPNSAGIVIDAVRCAKLGLDRKTGGPLIGPSAYFMKHPPEQYTDDQARQMVEDFIKGN
jgi:myo-inositol-1-phosphate synthase